MTSIDPLRDSASAIVEAADAFHRAAETRGSHVGAPESLASMQGALQVLSAAWYRLAADAVPGTGLSREQEVRLMGAMHDVAAAFARCARACRDGRSTVTPLISHPDAQLSWFASCRPPDAVLR
jgi:hypothetical protein